MRETRASSHFDLVFTAVDEQSGTPLQNVKPKIYTFYYYDGKHINYILLFPLFIR